VQAFDARQLDRFLFAPDELRTARFDAVQIRSCPKKSRATQVAVADLLLWKGYDTAVTAGCEQAQAVRLGQLARCSRSDAQSGVGAAGGRELIENVGEIPLRVPPWTARRCRHENLSL
jgi:hypothetical protein